MVSLEDSEMAIKNEEIDKLVAQIRECPDCGKRCFDWCSVCEKPLPKA
jgi:hypothetical protein